MRIGNQQLLIGAQIKNFRPEVLTEDPDVASLVAGQKAIIWYNETEDKYKYFNGSEIKALGGGAELPDNVVLADGSVAMTADLLLSGTDQSASDDKAAVSKGYVTSVLATAVEGKQDKFTGLTENGIVVAGPNNTLTTSNVTAAELGYLDGVTSSVQTQLDGKLDKNNATLTSDLNADGKKVTNLGAPTNANDAARKIDIDNALSGMNWQEDVDGVQADATLQPSKADGSRYVIKDATALHADFGTIADVQNNAIVEADADGEYHVVFDPTGNRADGAIAWNHATSQYVRFDGTAWANFGGMSSITAGDGLELDGNALNVQVDRAVTIVGNKVGVNVAAAGGIEVNGTNELAVNLDGATLVAGADGLKVADGGVGFTQLATAAFGTGIKVDAGKFVVDADALKTLGFIDATGGTVEALELTGDAADYTDTSAVNKAYVDQAIAAGGAAGAAKLYVYDKTAAEDTAATVHTFVHNAGTKFGTVTVFDDTGYQIIPDEVILVDDNTLRVEITEAKKLAIAFVTVPKSNGSTEPEQPAGPSYDLLVADSTTSHTSGAVKRKYVLINDDGTDTVASTAWAFTGTQPIASAAPILGIIGETSSDLAAPVSGTITATITLRSGDVITRTLAVNQTDATTQFGSIVNGGVLTNATVTGQLGKESTRGSALIVATKATGFGLCDSLGNSFRPGTTPGNPDPVLASGETVVDVVWELTGLLAGVSLSNWTLTPSTQKFVVNVATTDDAAWFTANNNKDVARIIGKATTSTGRILIGMYTIKASTSGTTYAWSAAALTNF